MNNAKRALGLVLVSLLAASAVAQQTEPTSALTTDQATDQVTDQIATRLTEWDQAYERLKRDIWTLQRGTAMFDRDFRGRTLSDDLRDFALTKSVEKRFSEQRALTADHLAKGETRLATETLLGLYRELRDELTGLERLGEHRLRQRQVAQQRHLWQQLAATVPTYQAPDTLRQLEQQALEQLQAGRFEQVSRTTYPALLQAYAQERAALWKRGAKPGSPILYARRTACESTAKKTSGNVFPSMSITGQPDYPAASRRAGEEGTVYLQVLAGSTGCALRYAVQFSSGWPALDDASLDWIETQQFVPAEKGGKAIDTWVTVPVVFHLTD